MSHSIFKIDFDNHMYQVLYDCIEDIKDAELLGQLAMVNKRENELIFITAGWNRGIEHKPIEYEKALMLAKEYKTDRNKINLF